MCRDKSTPEVKIALARRYLDHSLAPQLKEVVYAVLNTGLGDKPDILNFYYRAALASESPGTEPVDITPRQISELRRRTGLPKK